MSVVLSSHLVADLERVCDYLIVLVASRVRVAGEVSALPASHYRLSGRRRDPGALPRWLAVKLAVVGLGAMATAGLFSLLLTWCDRLPARQPLLGLPVVRDGIFLAAAVALADSASGGSSGAASAEPARSQLGTRCLARAAGVRPASRRHSLVR